MLKLIFILLILCLSQFSQAGVLDGLENELRSGDASNHRSRPSKKHRPIKIKVIKKPKKELQDFLSEELKQALENDLKKATDALDALDAFTLAKTKISQSDSSEAKTYFKQAIKLDSENPLYLSEFGFYLQSLGENDDAKPLLQKSLTIYEKTLGKEHPDTKKVRENLEKLQAVDDVNKTKADKK